MDSVPCILLLWRVVRSASVLSSLTTHMSISWTSQQKGKQASHLPLLPEELNTSDLSTAHTGSQLWTTRPFSTIRGVWRYWWTLVE